MKTFICTLALLISQVAHAANATKEIWEGAGSLFDIRGKPTENYKLVVENIKTGRQTRSNVTVTLANGSSQKLQCVTEETDSASWTSTCDFGKGGGHCFGDGLCLSYEKDASGRAFATTIAMDGPSDMRLLRTELKDGEAVQFFRERLHKR